MKLSGAAMVLLTAGLFSNTTSADIVHLDDVIITFSLCVGNDCVNGENFGFDTLRLKENNLRVHFDDTSSSASFPNNDWRIIINDSSNGGANYFAIEDSTAGRQPFRVEAGAPVNTLYVEADGDVGIKTANPVVDVHIVEGNTPTVRLEQDGSDGFTPQTWDLAGNEANFFIRDATNGSALPFRIFPGAPTDALRIEANGNIGLGTTSPDDSLDIENAAPAIRLTEDDLPGAALRMRLQSDLFRMSFADGGSTEMTMDTDANLTITSAAPSYILSEDDNAGDNVRFRLQSDLLRISFLDGLATEMTLDTAGNMVLQGSITTGGGTCGGGCDAVFDADYVLPTIEEHAELMWTNKYLPNVGPTEEGAPINVSDKLGRMLNELEKAHIYIEQLDSQNKKLMARLEKLEAKVDHSAQ